MKRLMILSVSVLACGGGAVHAQDAEPEPSAEQSREEIDEAEIAALMAPTGALGTDAFSGRMRDSLREAVTSQEVSSQLIQIPGIQERVRERFRSELPTQYPDVGEVVELSPVQVQGLFDLLTKQNEEARTSTASPEDRAKKEEAELSSLLGSKYPKWKEYKVGLPARLQVRDLNAALIAYEMELSQAEMDTLMSALTAADQQADPAIRAFSPESKRMLLDAAAPYLSPEQLEVYQKVLDRYSSRARAQGR